MPYKIVDPESHKIRNDFRREEADRLYTNYIKIDQTKPEAIIQTGDILREMYAMHMTKPHPPTTVSKWRVIWNALRNRPLHS